jgi:hypothetical protein
MENGRLIKATLLHFYIAVLILFSGCATKQINLLKSISVPENKIYDKSLMNTDIKNEKLSLIRDRGILGSACTHRMYINDKRAFDIDAGQALEVALEPGNYVLRIQSGGGFCPNTSIAEGTLLKLGEPQIFRISTSLSRSIVLSRIK